MGYQELAAYFICSKSSYSYVTGWTDVNNNYCSFLFPGSYFWRNFIRQMGSKKCPGKNLYQCNRIGTNDSFIVLLGFGHSLFNVVGAGLCFGVGFGMFDANNMPILCQFVPQKLRATAYGIMNMVGVFSGAFITDLLGKSSDAGNLGKSFAMLAGIVLIAVIIQVSFLRPKVNNYVD